MYRRLLPYFLLSIYTSTSSANDAAWNCEQSKDNKEWVCSGDNKPVDNAPKSAPTESEPVTQTQPATAKSIIKKEQPAITQPLNAKPAVVATPIDSKSTKAEDTTKTTAKPENPEPLPTTQSIPATLEQPAKPQVRSDTESKPSETDAQEPEISEAEARTNPSTGKASPFSSSQNNRAGWACGASDKSEGWDCNLVGTDPKGQAKAVTIEPSSLRLLTPAFDRKQEQTFNTLVSQLQYDPWEKCSVSSSPAPKFVPRKHLRESTPLDVKSDYSEVFDNEVSSYFGNVEMNRADQRSISNMANYDSVSETLGLQGSVYYSEDELALYSESALIKLAEDQSKMRDVLFISPNFPFRGRASAVYRENKALSRYKDAAYTSCKPGNQDWIVHASELKMNKDTGKGAAKNAWIEFKGVPVFYSPYLSFPIDDRRITGFLAPSFGNTQRNGFDFSIPFYWNIAPNFDATFKPRYLSERGIVLGGAFRYLTENIRGKLGVEYLPVDEKKYDNSYRNNNSINPHFDKARYLASFGNFIQFSPNITSNIDANYRSDVDYFYDLGSAISRPYNSFLRSSGDIAYRADGVSLIGRAESYQSVDRALDLATGGILLPYKRLPQVNLNLNRSFRSYLPLNTTMDGEYVYFQHDKKVTGQRFDLKPSISFPIQTASAFLTPKFSFQYTEYVLGNQPDGSGPLRIEYWGKNENNWVKRGTDNISRTLPTFSADAGLFLERDLAIGGNNFKHTLEPRLFYLYIPKVNQDEIPSFDTAYNDFNFSSMFRENRFSGTDRIGDANQITLALTSRLIDKMGQDRIKMSLGSIFYLSDRDVSLPLAVPDYSQNKDKYGRYPATSSYIPETNSFSNIVGELSTQLNDHISIDSSLQWTPPRNEIIRGKKETWDDGISRADITLHVKNRPGEVINLGYRYRKNTFIPDRFNDDLGRLNDIIMTDVSFSWPIYNNWSAVGRWQYSWLYNSTQDGFLGIEKENCCWRFRIMGRRWVNNINVLNAFNGSANLTLNNNAQADSQFGIFFQIELKGLTGIGEKLDDFFEQQIYGYLKPGKD